jgi:hypothetical protein
MQTQCVNSAVKLQCCRWLDAERQLAEPDTLKIQSFAQVLTAPLATLLLLLTVGKFGTVATCSSL